MRAGSLTEQSHPKRDRQDMAISYGLYLLERFGDSLSREDFEKLLKSTERRIERRKLNAGR
jgi:hypothetical protein